MNLGTSAVWRAFLVTGLTLVSLLLLVGEPVRGWLFIGILAGTTTAAVLAVVAGRRFGARRDATTYLLVGLVLLIPAYVLWYPAQLRWQLDLGSPSITDALFLAAYATFIASMVRLVRLRAGGDRRVQVLDTLIISVGLGVLTWVFVISPYLRDEQLGGWAKAIAVSYPLVDLLLLSGVVRLLVQRRARSVAEWLLAGWMIAQLAADAVYTVTWLRGTFTYATPTVLYALSFVLLGSALLHPSLRSIAEPVAPADGRAGLRRLALLGLATLIAPAVLVHLGLQGDSTDVAIVALLSAVLFGLVLARVAYLMVDVREHRRIQAQLQDSMREVRERSVLAERLSRIQREISSHAPLQDVLDAITAGAAELIGDEVVGLRLVDETDPDFMLMVSSVGVPGHLEESTRRLPVGLGAGGQAITEDRLCIAERYGRWDNAIGAFAADGLTAAMAAPVHLEGRSVGSLAVASHRPGRTYSQAERTGLVAFAEHVSLALNDAHTVQAMEAALAGATHQAMHDSLTGLPNRACFYDRTDQALRSAARDATHTAVLLFDLDRFKEVNDTLGHRYGDRLLREIGPRIGAALRDGDTLARLGGDEFCVLLPRLIDPADALDIATRVINVLEEPIEIDGITLAVGASCGIAVAPRHGDSADLLLQRADVAMYVAKTSHADVVTYADSLDVNTPARLGLLTELRAAITKDELVLHYQPQVASCGEVEGVEALVRWKHHRLGLVPPDQFVPLAEDTGLIKPLTAWVLATALRQLRAWTDAGVVGDGFAMSVNISTRSLLDDRFADEIVAALTVAGVRADRLKLEVTETAIMADPDRAARLLSELSAIGVRFAIDDFGTGYSSLAHLKSLPVDELKIDKSFVRHMCESPNDAIIVRAVIDLARNLRLRTVAEGVEDADTLAQLEHLGCDAAQGWLLARPMLADALPAWLTTHQRERTTVPG